MKINRNGKGQELRKVFVDTLCELILNDSRILALEADLGGASGFTRIAESFPHNFIQCGISEANMVGVSAGLSYRGFIPFIHSFSPFATRRVFDQLYLSAYSKACINIYGSDPGFCAGANGGTHTSYEDIALISTIPGSIICDAADENQLKYIIRKFSTLGEGIHYVRANRKAVDNIYDPTAKFNLGKGNLLCEGKDVLIISAGQLVSEALKAAEVLEKEGISSSVIDMFTIKPLDVEIIRKQLKGKKAAVVFENHNVYGGLGSMVSVFMAASGCCVPLKIHGVEEKFGAVGTPEFLQEKYQLTYPYLVESIKELLKTA